MSAWYEVTKEIEMMEEGEEKRRLAKEFGVNLTLPAQAQDAPGLAPKDRIKTRSDGGSTAYYTIPEHARELRHLISHKNMSKSRGDVFKACYRLGEKEGVDLMYELNKMEFFVQDLKDMYERGEHI